MLRFVLYIPSTFEDYFKISISKYLQNINFAFTLYNYIYYKIPAYTRRYTCIVSATYIISYKVIDII